VALSVEGLGKAGRFQGVSFEVRRGEVLGMAGLMGAGRTDVVSAIYGLEPADTGEIRVRGRAIRMRRPGDALAAGIGLVTEDRKTHGLVPAMGAGPNITLAALRRFCQWGCINHGAERRVVAEQRRVFAIKMTGPDQPVLRLSGGNQQKVVLARALLTEPAILLLDEPTRGIDVAAKAEVHALIRRLADEGRAVVLVSSEMPELLRLSDRLLVMRQGRVVGEMAARGATREEVLRLAMGMGKADPPSPA
jgi:ABC-type sugar transport system ATPase subunit